MWRNQRPPGSSDTCAKIESRGAKEKKVAEKTKADAPRERKSVSRKRGERQARAAEKGRTVRSYARELAREFIFKSDGKVARNRR